MFAVKYAHKKTRTKTHVPKTHENANSRKGERTKLTK